MVHKCGSPIAVRSECGQTFKPRSARKTWVPVVQFIPLLVIVTEGNIAYHNVLEPRGNRRRSDFYGRNQDGGDMIGSETYV